MHSLLFDEEQIASVLRLSVPEFREHIEKRNFPRPRDVFGQERWLLIDILEWQKTLPLANNPAARDIK